MSQGERGLPKEIARWIAWTTLAVVVFVAVRPWLKDWSTLGFHDWDTETSERYLTRLSLLRYHELPGWNPYACGGFPAWGYIEGATNLVSPFLPAYLLLPMSVALRVEVIGMALVGAIGAYMAASRFSSSLAARALVSALWAVNGRWGLQTASGHTWHLAYAYLPWCFYFYERARSIERRSLDVILGSAAIAMLVYAGGIYPLPHTAMALTIYAAILAVSEKRLRPLTTLAMLGVFGVLLSAPKLLPIADGFGKAPRVIDSTETMDLGAAWTMLTSRDQAFGSRPARVSPYGWHEWGIYIGVVGVLVLIVAFVFVKGRREAAMKALALAYVALGFGAFHAEAPWTLLHKVSIFRSQHVPSRFLYSAIFFAAIVAAAGLGRMIAKAERRFRFADALVALVVLAIGVDVASISAKPMADAMWMVPPDRIVEKSFHFEQEPPLQYKRRDWAGPMYLAMLANTGVINCYGAPPFDRKGAVAVTSPKFKGDVRVEGGGTAKVARWSPNRVDFDVTGAKPGELLVYDMNYDEGWSAKGGELVNAGDAIGVKLERGDGEVSIRYTPPGFGLGLVLFAVAAMTLARMRQVEKREGTL